MLNQFQTDMDTINATADDNAKGKNSPHAWLNRAFAYYRWAIMDREIAWIAKHQIRLALKNAKEA